MIYLYLDSCKRRYLYPTSKFSNYLLNFAVNVGVLVNG
ncbi:hypothetical protein CWATWH8502_2637 [Crocosphaera watsonii WH 8502]|uniref:Uncharacterized protein n=2 Tax=Crocosphaera watsonii TaxID=263511 RepID=T2JB70_CROWT|nr:hypothetical protein CWATWH8502_2637 [Crocosphaera watsonii WH 8502]CCQ62465.1 hypothetical protein CWATWH0401_2088 [Crocosphaera watsonii WH 0401]